MYFRTELARRASKEARGIEICPSFTPAAPKREGYDCLSLDTADARTLKLRALADPLVPPEKVSLIEAVDLVGDAARIDALCREKGVSEVDYILFSHHFERLPNPVAFLQACGRVLKTGGYLSLSLPDKRAGVDFFRPRTSLGAWIEAFFEGREQPTLAQVFEQDSLAPRRSEGGRPSPDFLPDNALQTLDVAPKLHEAFAQWKARREGRDAAVADAHCWAFTPSGCHALLSDLYFLGLSPFVVEEVAQAAGGEFHAHLRFVGFKAFSAEERAAHYAAREKLLRAALVEESRVGGGSREIEIIEGLRARWRGGRADTPLDFVRALLLLSRRRDLALARQYLAVCGSVFFDRRYYRDVHGGGADAAGHYLRDGVRLGCDPGPFFSTRKYLEANPDVAERGMNPLAHYELFGRAEGRGPALR